jgi:hypothetical protein
MRAGFSQHGYLGKEAGYYSGLRRPPYDSFQQEPKCP